MESKRSLGILGVAVLAAAGTSHADFKYTQQSKVTGGTLLSMTKTLGVLSKSARQVGEPQTSTTMVRGNRMRLEQSTGAVEIIDLDGRRFIHVDPAKKAYSVMTFDQMKAQIQQAQERMKEEQAKAMAKNPNAQNIKMVPKFESKATGATRTVLDLPTNEVKMRMDMEIQSDDPKVKQQMQSMSYWFTSDAWVAASVPGYDEMKQFYLKMAKELDWLPGMMMGNMGMANPQMSQAMEEFRKNSVRMNGMPLLQYASFGMAATGVPAQQPASGQATQQQPAAQQPQQTGDNSAPPTNAKEAIAKGLGGMFGGFGKKKKQQDQPQQPAPAQANGGATTTGGAASQQPVTVSNSMMDMTIEVTSFSSSSLDKSLFDVPAGYTQVQHDSSTMFGSGQR